MVHQRAEESASKTAAICYAVGWTQHATGVQIIRAASILQLLLGNIGRPDGGILAFSSCGLCGKAIIEAVHQHFPPVAADFSVPADLLLTLPGQLQQAQQSFHRTGGAHAAALFTSEGPKSEVRTPNLAEPETKQERISAEYVQHEAAVP